jgi:hypothetical protein
MKKIILLLTLCLLFQTIKAQITANISYQKGTFLSGGDSLVPNSISPGSKGANQTWDFTALRNIYEDTTIYMDASSSPYFSKFPNANLTIYGNTTTSGRGKSYSYLYADTNNHYTFYGSFINAGGQQITAYASQPSIDTVTALSYGKTNKDTLMITETFPFVWAGIDSIKTITHETSYDTVDAWGTVILPGNISYNSLRSKSVTYFIYENYMRYYGNWMYTQTTYDTLTSYAWYTDIFSQSLVELFLDSSGKMTSSKYYLPFTATGLQSKALTQENLRAFPNPARANFSLDISGIDKSQINVSLVSATGETFFPDWNIQGDALSVKTSSLKTGLYHWMLKSSEGKFYQGSVLID